MLDSGSIFFGIFLGIVSSVIIFDFILYVIYKESVYLTTFFGLVTLSAVVILIEGTIFQYLFVFPSRATNPVSYILLTISQYLSYHFANEFTKLVFNTRKTSPRIDFFCSLFRYLNAGVFIIIMLLYFLFNTGRQFDSIVTPFVRVIFTILILGAGFNQLRMGNKQAILFIIGWALLIFGMWLKLIEMYSFYSGVKSSNFFLRNGLFIGWFAIVINSSVYLVQRISRTNKEREEQNRQMIQLDKMVSIGMITSIVSHEIKNPLSVILSNSEFLTEYFLYLKDHLDGFIKKNDAIRVGNFDYQDLCTRYGRALEDVIKCCYRIDSTIDHLRKFYRQANIDSMSVLNLNDVVEEAMYLISHKIRKAAANTVIDCAKDLPSVKGNFQLLEQVVVNLLINACQALETKSENQDRTGSLSIRTFFDTAAEVIVLLVRDTGPGMDEKVLERLAEPFFTTKGEGSGLGLYISKEIVQNHGGDIVFQSMPGKGTEVRVMLPASTKLAKK